MKGARRILVAAALIGAVLIGLAAVALTASDPEAEYAEGISVAVAPLEVACGDRTVSLPARWSIPDGQPTALAWVQHGFARTGERMADLADRLAADGLLVVTPTVDALGGCSLSDAAAIVAGIAGILSERDGGALLTSAREAGMGTDSMPSDLVLVGHSAGGAAMTGVAAALVEADAAASLRLLLLLDPVESRGGMMAASLPALDAVEVLAIAGEPGPCNADASGPAALAAARDAFHGVRIEGGCHCDPEGDSTNAACTVVCGSPADEDVALLRRLAGAWVADAVGGTRTDGLYPGGDELERLIGEETVTVLGGG
ncbi:MAG TPA: hypothetical protein VLA59_05645 [Patescibacteria group bacterium]|nr:hypothetical protein [Patescibacteria group bacterium]